MVHEITPNATARDVVVNSTSLEDVPRSEVSFHFTINKFNKIKLNKIIT